MSLYLVLTIYYCYLVNGFCLFSKVVHAHTQASHRDAAKAAVIDRTATSLSVAPVNAPLNSTENRTFAARAQLELGIIVRALSTNTLMSTITALAAASGSKLAYVLRNSNSKLKKSNMFVYPF